MSSIFQFDEAAADDDVAAKTAGLTISAANKQTDEMGRSYMTISQAANDKHQQMMQRHNMTGVAK